MVDVWFDGVTVEPVVMRQLETKLQRAFKLPTTQAALLVSGNSHRIKRGCSADEVQKLAAQFGSWSAKVRIEAVEDAVESSTSDEMPSLSTGPPTSSLTLAAVGENDPTQGHYPTIGLNRSFTIRGPLASRNSL